MDTLRLNLLLRSLLVRKDQKLRLLDLEHRASILLREDTEGLFALDFALDREYSEAGDLGDRFIHVFDFN